MSTHPESLAPLPAPATAAANLLHLIGDVVHPSSEPFPTSAAITMLGLGGHEPTAVRQALARAGRSGWVVPERAGRQTWWRVTDEGSRLVADGLGRIARLAEDRDDWNGRWVVVTTSIPHARRAIRERVYRYLTWSGFGSPTPGVWVSPHPDNEAGARFAIEHFGLSGSSLSFVGSSGSLGLRDHEIVARAWDLDDLDDHYRGLLSRHRHEVTGRPAAVQALFDLDGSLQVLPSLDPQLPADLSPGRVSREAARELLRLRAGWRDPARAAWEELVAGHGV